MGETFVLGLPTPEVYKFSYRWVFLRARIRSEVSLAVFCIRNHRGLLTSKLSSSSRVQEVRWGWGMSRRSCKFYALLNRSVVGWPKIPHRKFSEHCSPIKLVTVATRLHHTAAAVHCLIHRYASHNDVSVNDGPHI